MKKISVVCVMGLLALMVSRTSAQVRSSVKLIADIQPNNQVTAVLDFNAVGTENAFGASVKWDPEELSYVSFETLSLTGGATILVNPQQQEEGRLGFIYGLPTRRLFPVGSQKFMKITFWALKPGKATLAFGDNPVRREVVSPQALVLPATFVDADVEVPPPFIGFFYPGSTRGYGPVYVLAGQFSGAQRAFIVAVTSGREQIIGELLPGGDVDRFVFVPPEGYTFFLLRPVVNGRRLGDILLPNFVVR